MERKATFAKGYSFFKYFWIFILGCMVGYVYESIISIVSFGSFKSFQGLLYGPFIPVYGVGAVTFLFVFKRMRNPYAIFFLSILVGGIVEFAYSFLQELIFGTISWDYSTHFMNLQGRTSLVCAVFWGLVGVVFIKYIYPNVSRAIEKVPQRIGNIVTWIFILIMIVNISMTVMVSLRQKDRIKQKQATNTIEKWIDYTYPDSLLNNLYYNRIRK